MRSTRLVRPRPSPRGDADHGGHAPRRGSPVVISSQLLNRQDGEDEYHVTRGRRSGRGWIHGGRASSTTGVLVPRPAARAGRRACILGYRCANSGMTLACGYRQTVTSESPHEVTTTVGPDLAKSVVTVRAEPGETIRVVKLVSYHTSRGVPAQELADRCSRTLERAHAGRARAPRRRPARVAQRVLGAPATSSCAATIPRSRRCAGTCSTSPRRAHAPHEQGIAASGRDRLPATRATTSGTPRSTSSRSSPTRTPKRRAACCASGG